MIGQNYWRLSAKLENTSFFMKSLEAATRVLTLCPKSLARLKTILNSDLTEFSVGIIIIVYEKVLESGRYKEYLGGDLYICWSFRDTDNLPEKCVQNQKACSAWQMPTGLAWEWLGWAPLSPRIGSERDLPRGLILYNWNLFDDIVSPIRIFQHPHHPSPLLPCLPLLIKELYHVWKETESKLCPWESLSRHGATTVLNDRSAAGRSLPPGLGCRCI